MIVDIAFLRNCPVFYLQQKNAHYSILYHFLQAGIGLLFDGKNKKFLSTYKQMILSFICRRNKAENSVKHTAK